MASTRRTAVLALAVLTLALTGCRRAAAPAARRAPDSPPPSGTADGVIDRVIGYTNLAKWPNDLMEGLAVDATGAPIVALQDDAGLVLHRLGGPATARPTVDVPAGFDDAGVASLDAAGDGSLVMTFLSGDEGPIEGVRVAPDGSQSALAIPDRYDTYGVTYWAAALAPDGHTLYVAAWGGNKGWSRLLAVGAGPGASAVVAEADLDPTFVPKELGVTSSGEVLLAGEVPVGNSNAKDTAVLDRFDPALHPLGETPLVPDRHESQVVDMALAADGTPWLAVFDDDASPDDRTLDLLKMPAGATGPAVVASWHSSEYAPPLPDEHSLAVAADGSMAYLLNVPREGGPVLPAAVTPVTTATGAVGRTIQVDPAVVAPRIALSPDGRELFLAGSHSGGAATDAGEPAVWTLG